MTNTLTPPKRKFESSVWAVDMFYELKYQVESDTFLFAIDNYEGAVEKWRQLVEQDKKIGVHSEMMDDIEQDPACADSWTVAEELPLYSVKDENGDATIVIELYEHRVHEREKK